MSPLVRHKPSRSLLVAFAYLALTLRLLMPAGYMPSADGWFMTVCHLGLPADSYQSLLQQSHHHGHHTDHHQQGGDDQHEYQTDNSHCPMGTALSLAVAVADAGTDFPDFVFVPVHRPSRLVGVSYVYPHFRSRAPPVFLA